MTVLESIRTLDALPLERKRVLVRADLDVPFDFRANTVVRDDRIRAVMPTLELLMAANARVIVAAGLSPKAGRPHKAAPSMEPVGAKLAELGNWDVILPDDCVGEAPAKAIEDAREGQIVLLENLYQYEAEDTGDELFARQLADLADVYVNEALGASHRSLTSLVTLPRLMLDRGAGVRFATELAGIDRIVSQPELPLGLVLGNGKPSTRIDQVERMIGTAAVICIGGALAYGFLAASGARLGATRVDPEVLPRLRTLLTRAADKGTELVLPEDLVVGEGPRAEAGQVVSARNVPDGMVAFDIGPATVSAYADRVQKTRTLLWLGAMGLVDKPAFAQGTIGVARSIAFSPCYSVTTDLEARQLAAAGADLGSSFGLVTHAPEALERLLDGQRIPGVDALLGGR